MHAALRELSLLAVAARRYAPEGLVGLGESVALPATAPRGWDDEVFVVCSCRCEVVDRGLDVRIGESPAACDLSCRDGTAASLADYP